MTGEALSFQTERQSNNNFFKMSEMSSGTDQQAITNKNMHSFLLRMVNF
jgi:hypothetical protein